MRNMYHYYSLTLLFIIVVGAPLNQKQTLLFGKINSGHTFQTIIS